MKILIFLVLPALTLAFPSIEGQRSHEKGSIGGLQAEARKTFENVQKIFVGALGQHKEVIAEEAAQFSSDLDKIATQGMSESQNIINVNLGPLYPGTTVEELADTFKLAAHDLDKVIKDTANQIEDLVAQSDVADRVIYISSRMALEIKETFKPFLNLIGPSKTALKRIMFK